jgi:hypothetical protein
MVVLALHTLSASLKIFLLAERSVLSPLKTFSLLLLVAEEDVVKKHYLLLPLHPPFFTSFEALPASSEVLSIA